MRRSPSGRYRTRTPPKPNNATGKAALEKRSIPSVITIGNKIPKRLMPKPRISEITRAFLNIDPSTFLINRGPLVPWLRINSITVIPTK